MLPNAHKRRIGKVVLPPRSRRAKSRINPTSLLLRKRQLRLEVRRSRPPLGRSDRRNNPSPPPLKWAGNLLRQIRRVWWYWTLERRQTLFATDGWTTAIPFWNVGEWRKRFRTHRMRDLNLEKEKLAKKSTQRISKLALLDARARLRRLRWMQIFQRYCVRGRWRPWVPSWTLKRTCCPCCDTEFAPRRESTP